MYLHGSAQQRIHLTAIENGWRVHKHSGSDTEPQWQTGSVEYRRGTRDYVRVEYGGAQHRLYRAASPQRYMSMVAVVCAYLERPFGGRIADDLPPAPAKRFQVVVWNGVHAFADAEMARAFEDEQVGAGHMVTAYEWKWGAFVQVRERNRVG